jgi:hypothetical protein
VVLLDWEDTEGDREATQEILEVHPTSTAVLWPADMANPEVGASYHGIERFLGSGLLAEAAAAGQGGIVQTVGENQTFELMPKQRGAVKQRLRERCEARNNPEDLRHIIDALPWLEEQIPLARLPERLPGL